MQPNNKRLFKPEVNQRKDEQLEANFKVEQNFNTNRNEYIAANISEIEPKKEMESLNLKVQKDTTNKKIINLIH